MAEFQFPDEVEKPTEDKVEFEVEGEGETQVEIVDDTPEEDKGRTPMKEPPADVTDDELEKYSDSVKKRIQHFSKGYHEERRAKEAALREREEALRLAKVVAEENKRLKGSLSQNEQTLHEQAKKAVDAEVDHVKTKVKEAYDNGNPNDIVFWQDKLADVKIKQAKVYAYKPAALQEQKVDVQPDPVEAAPSIDHKAVEWQRQNKWFGSDDEMTSFALGLHNKLVKSGVDPQSDEYYKRLNARIREVFPDAFESGEPTDAPPPPPKKSNVVAPVTRSTAPKKIVLTKSQVSIAKRLGVPLEAYARQVAEEMRKQNA